MFQMTAPEQARTLEGRAYLCRVPTGRWSHVSPGKPGQHPKLRPLDGGGTRQVAHRDQLFADLMGAICYSLDDLNRLSRRLLKRLVGTIQADDLASWRRLAEYIDAHPDDMDATKRVIRTTCMRKLYTQVRQETKDQRWARADRWARDVSELAALILAAIDEFVPFNNAVEPFIGHDASRTDISNATHFAPRLVAGGQRHGGVQLATTPPEWLAFVARELNPTRATLTQHDDGRSGLDAGAGGIDILLESKNHLPVVCEVKAATDTDPLLALVQALTYAVELVTPSQRRRLEWDWEDKKHFQGLGSLTIGPFADVFIVTETSERYARWVTPVRDILHQLEGTPAVAAWFRRIRMVEAQIDPQEGRVTFL